MLIKYFWLAFFYISFPVFIKLKLQIGYLEEILIIKVF